MQGCLAPKTAIVTTAIIFMGREDRKIARVGWLARRNQFPPEGRPLAMILNRIY